MESLDYVYQIIEDWALVILLILFISELVYKMYVNWGHQTGIVEDQSGYFDISADQRGTALFVASMVFAGLSIIFSNQPQQFTRAIEVFIMAFGLLLIATFSHQLTGTYRAVLTIQEMALEYGLLVLVLGLFLIIHQVVPGATDAVAGVFAWVFLIRFASVKGELEAHRGQSFNTSGWFERRQLTLVLIAFYWFWYWIQMTIFGAYGLGTAEWWFYFSNGSFWPGITISPGILLSTVSHNMESALHLIGNSVALFAIGGFSEPYIRRRGYLTIVLGLGFLSIIVANAFSILFGTEWALAGASGGILALLSYITLKKRRLARLFIHSKKPSYIVEGLFVVLSLLFIPLAIFHELVVSGNIGHVAGLAIGLLAFFGDSRAN